ncbi:hypothetical protein FB477_001239 [Trueperella pyogenes]|nr:hypothetical protein [Trueperella pyogenes]
MEVDLEGQRAGHALHGTGKGDRGAEFAERTGKGQRRARGHRRRQNRQRDPAELHPLARPQALSGVLKIGAGGPRAALDRHHQEGQGDEDLGEDHCRRREWNLQPGHLQGRAEETAPTEGHEQSQARHHRRHDQRDQHERAQRREPPGSAGQLGGARQDQRQWRAHQEACRGGDGASAQGEQECGGGGLGGKNRPELAPRHARGHADQRQREHDECHARREPEARGDRAQPHRFSPSPVPNPCLARIS